MSMAVRSPLFRSVICVAESVALIASFIASIVEPRMTVVTAMEMSSSTSVNPRSRRADTRAGRWHA